MAGPPDGFGNQALGDLDSDLRTMRFSTESLVPREYPFPFQVTELGDGTVTLNNNKFLNKQNGSLKMSVGRRRK